MRDADPFALLAFFWTTGALVVLSRRVASRLLPEGDRVDLGLATVVLAAALPVVTLEALHLVGAIAPTSPAIVYSLGLALLAWDARRPRRRSAQETADPAKPSPERLSAAIALAAGAIVVGWGVGVLPSTAFAWDDFSYHAANPGAWLAQMSLELPSLTYQSYFALNAELVAFSFMLPIQGDAHANLSVVLWALVLGLAFRSAAKRLNHDPWITGVTLFTLFGTRMVFRNTETFCGHDLAAAAFPLAAIAFYRPGRGLGFAVLSGVSMGFAVGVRSPLGAIALALAIAWGWKDGRRAAGLFVAAAAAVGGFWLMRNLLITGNPMYPAEFLGLDGPFDAVTRRQTALSSLFREDSAAAFELLGTRLFNWPFALGAVAGVGVLAGLVASVRDSSALRRVLVVGLAIFLLTYPSMPFSYTNNLPEGVARAFESRNPLRSRHVIFAYATGLLLVGDITRNRRVAAVVGAIALVPSLADVWGPIRWWWGAGAAAGVLAWASARWLRRRLAGERIPGWVRDVVLIGFAGALTLSTQTRAENTTAEMFGRVRDEWRPPRRVMPGSPRVTHAWKQVWKLPEGSRVAMFNGLPSSHGLYYPLFGPDYALTPVPVYPDGMLKPRLHEEDPPDEWFWEFDDFRRARKAASIACNLYYDAEVDYLLVFRWPRRVLSRPRAMNPMRALAKRHDALVYDRPNALLIDLEAIDIPCPDYERDEPGAADESG
jgi:hypothetical protein